MKNKILKLIYGLGSRGFFKWIPSKTYIKMLWYFEYGKLINLNEPKTFNEKLQWLKLYDHNDLYTDLVDKIEVKKYISDKIGDEYLIKNLWVGNNPRDIPYNDLPLSFVIKCNHGSHCNIIVKDKNKINKEEIAKKLNKWLKRNWYYYGREWPYKNVKPRILIEEYMVDQKSNDLNDYKFFCFNGEPKFFKIDFNRFTSHQANYYDINGKIMKFGEKNFPPNYDLKIELPEKLNQMIDLSRKIAKNFLFVRIDFYQINNKVYFGEITFYPASGFGKFTSDEYDYEIGKYLILPLKNDNKNIL